MTGCIVQSSAPWEDFISLPSLKASPERSRSADTTQFLLASTYQANASVNQALAFSSFISQAEPPPCGPWSQGRGLGAEVADNQGV